MKKWLAEFANVLCWLTTREIYDDVTIDGLRRTKRSLKGSLQKRRLESLSQTRLDHLVTRFE